MNALASRALLASPLLASLFVTLPASAQTAPFTPSPQYIPFGSANVSPTSEIDFADTDNDGDWDALLANGGEWGLHQCRLWCNMDGLQGGVLGNFLDGSTIHFPMFSQPALDVEIADFDGDGDEDLFWVNHSLGGPQSGRFWTNQAGIQGGSISYFVDDNAARWAGLGGSGSSVPSSELLVGGGYRSWSTDAQFFDMDDDGDLDLVHSSFGDAHDGLAPTRLFVNDGLGVFSEFNPSNHQLSGVGISNGEPALWCNGTQSDGTLDTTGAFADIAGRVIDVEIGDIDGDFDLDMLFSNEGTRPRAFVNRSRGSALAPAGTGFRDVTAMVFPSWTVAPTTGGELELLDWDLDGDLELFGLDWGTQFEDVLLEQVSPGVFGGMSLALGGVLGTEAEMEVIDYNNDGALDLYISRPGADDKLYEHSALASTPQVVLFNGSSDDAEISDVDGDGDWDIMVAAENFGQNMLLINTTDIPDTTVPTITRLETVALSVGTAPNVVHGMVNDNVPAYLTRTFDVSVPFFVDGCRLGAAAATWSGSELFRAELPGNLVGNVSYGMTAVDMLGNIGTSSFVNTTASGPAFTASYGSASPSSIGDPEVVAMSVPYAGETLYLVGRNAQPGEAGILLLAPQTIAPAFVAPGNFTLNVGGPFFHWIELGTVDANGCLVADIQLPANLVAGQTSYAQFITTGGTTQTFACSKGLSIVSQ